MTPDNRTAMLLLLAAHAPVGQIPTHLSPDNPQARETLARIGAWAVAWAENVLERIVPSAPDLAVDEAASALWEAAKLHADKTFGDAVTDGGNEDIDANGDALAKITAVEAYLRGQVE